MAAESRHSATPRRRRSTSNRERWRYHTVTILFGLGLLGMVARLFTLQVLNGAEYSDIARRQYESRVPLQADRGAIYDRNGTLLATSVPALSFAVDPENVEDPDHLAGLFAEVLGGSAGEYREKVTMEDRSFVWIARKVAGNDSRRLGAVEDQGLITLTEPLRRFEFGTIGSQIIGCVNLDNVGLSGVELAYNDVLRGKEGYMVMQRDARGYRRPDVDLPRVDPEHGENLELTIDITVQSIVEDELARGVAAADASSGTVVALKPQTGEILALASWPTFDPNNLPEADQSGVRPRGVTDTYEPGSTMKAISAAAALEEGVVRMEEIVDGEGGEYRLPDGTTIRDDHPFGAVTFTEAFRQSSNVILAKVAGRLDPKTFYRYVRDFGFGMPTGLDLPGEVRGEVKPPEQFSEETQAFMAYGYQLAVTPIQLAAAYGAIANDGRLMKPFLLKRRFDRNGNVVEEREPVEVRQVISPETAARLRYLLGDVVSRGTGQAAQLVGVSVAGKTGTAQQLHDGSYQSERYNASFVGFFPAEKPEMVLLVLLSDPKNGYYGGQVAAPIFSAIARRVVNATMVDERSDILRTAFSGGGARNRGEEDRDVYLPDLRGLDREVALEVGAACGLRIRMNGEGESVLTQNPPAGTRIQSGQPVTLDCGTAGTISRVPDLRGLPMRRALAIASRSGLDPLVRGTGIVVAQSPAPGTRIDRSEGRLEIVSR